MAINKSKSYWLLLLLPFLIGCPWGDEKCFDEFERITTIEDLIIITPLKDTFRIGDTVSMEINITDSIYFGEIKVNLLNETNDLSPSIIIPQRLGFINFFNSDLHIIEGEQVEDKNKFRFKYSFEDNLYKLLLVTIFSIEGDYWFSGSNDIVFGKVKDCNFYRITTNLKGAENGKWLEFVVVE
ncbi:MAG: hypothetical protein EA409_00435 [Saprospirales bacterium]|nr:MAG: hypothetical protein EA409_00435 [Saprospirales bacterium]